jgi:CheY-like chemotaxis protein
MHQGTITATSAGPNRGSEFTIRLPLAGPAAAAEVQEVPAEPPAAAPGRRILIVEDHDDSREMLTEALALKGHEIRSVADGPSALDAASKWHPDVVILDIGLPGMSGHAVARRLRQQPELRDVVLIALTGWGQEHDRRRSSAAGIAHHLTKPLDPDKLDQLLGVLADVAPERGDNSQHR